MTGFIELIALIGIIYFTVKMYKNRKSTGSRISKSTRKNYRIGLFASIAVLIITGAIGGGSEETTSKQSSNDADTATKVVKKQKYVGKGQYNIAKKENLALIAKKKKLEEQAEDLEDQQDKIESDEAAAKKQEQEAQAAAQKQQEEQQKQQAEQAAAAQKQQEQSATSQQTKGDMNTGDTGTIVGNVNSHIYHVPGQAGYNMNSANAVYFHSEQEAINAGYRRSKR